MKMKTIKFRAWDKCNKSMYIVDQISFRDGYLIDLSIGSSYHEPIENFELMQFTGLYDKNGKEIYEGDILKISDPSNIVADYNVEICWSEKELSFAFKESSGYWQRPTESMWAWILDKKIKILGNIYENPELLEER